MKGLAKVLCIILLVGIIASGTTISYGNAEGTDEFVPKIALMNKTDDEITFISGKLTEKSDELPEEIVKKVYAKNFENLETKQEELEFEIIEKFTNSMGRTVIKTIQVVEGVPVYGSERNFHINNAGVLEVISGKNVGNINKSTKKSVSIKIPEKEIINLIENNLEQKLEEKISVFNMSQPQLILYPVKDIYEYVYKVVISVSEPEPDSFTYYITAENLDVVNVEKSSTRVKTSVYGTGVGEFGLIEDLKMAEEDEMFYLINLDENFETGEAVNFQVFSNTQNHFEADPNVAMSRLTHGVDAHYNLTGVIEFFKDYFNRNSYDDNGGLIRCRIMFGPHNARAEQYGNWGDHSEIWFYNRKPVDEDGNEITDGRSTAAALDIVAHEFTHLLLFHEGLNYNNGQENMILHEGLADTFAVICEYALESYLLSKGESDWIIGEDTGKAMRNAAYPEITQYSDVLNMDPFIPHSGGGVITKAAYLIAEGGIHNGKKIEGIGYSKLANIFYSAMTDGYIVPRSSLVDFASYAVAVVNLFDNEQYKHNSIKSGKSIYYDYKDVNTVIDAFTSVELLTGTPDNFRVTNIDGLSVEFAWDGIDGGNYGIFRSKTGSGHSPKKVAETTNSQIVLESLPGKYDYYIALIDGNGNRITAFSDAVTVETYLKAPKNFREYFSIGLIVKFKWDYSGTPGTRYGIYMKCSNLPGEPIKVAETPFNMFYTISIWGSYDYYVAIVDEKGERISDYSNKVTVTSPICY
jgi:Zn-dependent metalloprotease